MIYVLLLVVILLLTACVHDSRKPKNYPKGPKWLPIIGNYTQFRQKLKRHGFHHLVFMDFAKEYGNIIGLRMGLTQVVAVHGPELVREILSREEFEGRPDGFFFKMRTFGKRLGIVFADGHLWQRQRKFSLHHLKNLGLGRRQMELLIETEARILVNSLLEHLKVDNVIEMKHMLDISVLNALWAMLAGQRFALDDEKLLELTRLIHEAFTTVDSSGGLINQMPFLRYIIPGVCGYTKICEIIYKLMNFFKETLEEHKRNFSIDNPRDLIDIFIQKMSESEDIDTFTEEQLLSLCLDLFMAGTETTSNTLAFSLLYMAVYTDVQAKVQAELDDITSGNRLPTLQDRLKLPYTEAVMMEIQRMANIAPLGIPHRAVQDVNVCGYNIPRGTMVLTNIYSVHMNAQFWKDPDLFQPERFIGADGKLTIPEKHFLPFGYGKRRCLGESLAKANYFIFFTALLHNFKIEKDPHSSSVDLIGRDGFTLTPTTVKIKLQSRNI